MILQKKQKNKKQKTKKRKGKTSEGHPREKVILFSPLQNEYTSRFIEISNGI